MPELPEVETIVRTLSPQIVGTYIRDVHILHQKTLQAGEELLPQLIGAQITTVFRRAKLLLVGVLPEKKGIEDIASTPSQKEEENALPKDVPLFMAFHLKMTGRFFVHPSETMPLKHTRIIFDLATKHLEKKCTGRLFFDDMRTFGYCRIMRPADFAQWAFWQKLGLEPLLSSPQHIAKRLHEKKMGIKSALLDQHVIAGVGNIYADESLFRAGILPSQKTCDIAYTRLEKLAVDLQAVLQQSIDECGSSIRDYRDAKGNAGAFQNNFFVYGRKDQPCKLCGTSLQGSRIAGRGTVHCPMCQK